MKMAIGFVLGWMLSVPVWLYWSTPENPELELAAYRECMVQAQRCRMTPQDFIRYYELKHQLEKEHDRSK